MSSGGVASQGGGEESPLVREAAGFLAEEKTRRGVEEGMHAAESAVTKLESAARSIGSNAGSLSLSFSLAHSHSLTRSFSLSLAHSFTRSLTHLLTRLLSHNGSNAARSEDWASLPAAGLQEGYLPISLPL